MTPWDNKIVQVFHVYLERGKKALKFYSARDWDAFLEELDLQERAFHNLKALEFMARREGWTPPPALVLQYKEILEIQSKIRFALEDSRRQFSEDLRKGAHVRRGLQSYHSQPSKRS